MASTARAPRRSAGRKPALRKGRARVAAVKVKKPARKPAAKAHGAVKPKGKATARLGRAAPRPATPPPPETARLDWRGLSLMDAFDLAILVEAEAEERYGKLAALVGGQHAGDAGDVFQAMSRNERLHRQELETQRRRLFGEAPRRLRPEQLDDVEAPDWSSAGVFLAPRKAAQAALASEEKAHAFYAAARHHVKDRAVRKLFDDLAAEELRHQATLRELVARLPAVPDVDPDLADEPGSDPGN